jgi:hypothetical protein
MIVYLSPKAVFVDCVARGYCLVCKAPDWKVTMYSPKSKLHLAMNALLLKL